MDSATAPRLQTSLAWNYGHKWHPALSGIDHIKGQRAALGRVRSFVTVNSLPRRPFFPLSQSTVDLATNCWQARARLCVEEQQHVHDLRRCELGNCYKVKLLAEQLALPYRWVGISTLKKETQSDAFLKKNPNGKIPLLETKDGRFLPESNAILHFLAEGTELLPIDLFEHAQVLQWLFFSSTAMSHI